MALYGSGGRVTVEAFQAHAFRHLIGRRDSELVISDGPVHYERTLHR